MCATKALLAGDAPVVSDIYRERVLRRGKAGDAAWGWMTAYGKPEQAQERTQERAREQNREGQK